MTTTDGLRTTWFRRGTDTLLIPSIRDFPKLWTASAVSFFGDGIYLAALPLLAADLSSSPTTVAAVVSVTRLPWLLFSLPAGALADAWDRKRIMWIVDVVRAVLMALFALAILSGWASIPLLMVLGFTVACADTVFDSGSFAIVPKMVSRDPDMVRAMNVRLTSAQIFSMNFLGPPIGGFLFVASRMLPFAGNAVSFGVSALFLRRMRGDYRMGTSGVSGKSSLRQNIRDGMRWMWGQPMLRSITMISGVFSLMSLAQMAILVLYAQEVLHLGAFGYGALLAVGAVGSLIGTLLARRVNAAIGSSAALSVALASGGTSCLMLGFSSTFWVAGLGMVLGGLASMVWNVIQISLRQSCTPDDLIGRVNGVHKLVTWGAMPLGAMLGGFLAKLFGLHAPYLAAGVVIISLGLVARLTITTSRVAAAQAATPR